MTNYGEKMDEYQPNLAIYWTYIRLSIKTCQTAALLLAILIAVLCGGRMRNVPLYTVSYMSLWT